MSKHKEHRLSAVRLVFAMAVLVMGLGLSAKLMLGGAAEVSHRQTVPNLTIEPSLAKRTTKQTRPIETLRVGDRVLSHNPEVTDAERSLWETPDWQSWVHLSLEMPLSAEDHDAGTLNIEILRPESWLIAHAEYLCERTKDAASPLCVIPTSEPTRAPDTAEFDKVPLSPLRPAFRWLEFADHQLQEAGLDLTGLTVELDMPEMGATGTAVVTGIAPCPLIGDGDGNVVTATFSHPPSTTVLDVIIEGESSPIGVTDNHLFWSPAREAFVPIGEIPVGDELITLSGELRSLEAKHVREGTHLVYNLEVYGEHVYFVGDGGLLAHNAYAGRTPKKVRSPAEIAYRAARSRARFEASAHTITLRQVPGMPRREFLRKARALQELGEQGRLIRRTTPRDTSITRAYRQDTINRIWAQYGQRNREFANRLIHRVTRRMSPDHVHELQLMGPDRTSNLRWLDRFTNEHIGMRQIWPQIRSLPEGTPIRIVIQ